MKLGDTPGERDANRWLIIILAVFILLGVVGVATLLTT